MLNINKTKTLNLKSEIVTYITKAVYNFMLFTGLYFKYKDSAKLKFLKWKMVCKENYIILIDLGNKNN